MKVDIVLSDGNNVHIDEMDDANLIDLIDAYKDPEVTVLSIALTEPTLATHLNKQHIILIEVSDDESVGNS